MEPPPVQNFQLRADFPDRHKETCHINSNTEDLFIPTLFTTVNVLFQKISIPPTWKGWRKFREGGWGEAGRSQKYETELEVPEGWGSEVQSKNPSLGGVWVFSGITQSACRQPISPSRKYLVPKCSKISQKPHPRRTMAGRLP